MSTTDAAIAGLREQITANAILLFPASVNTYQRTLNSGNGELFYVPPAGAFNVVVVKTVKTGRVGRYEAIIVHKQTSSRDGSTVEVKVEKGGATSNVHAASGSLMEVVAMKLGRKLEGGGERALDGDGAVVGKY